MPIAKFFKAQGAARIFVLPVALVLVLITATSDTARASFLPVEFTGCLNENSGLLQKVARGDTPARPCVGDEIVVQFTSTDMTQDAVEDFVQEREDAILAIVAGEVQRLDARIDSIVSGGDVAAEAAARADADAQLQADLEAEAGARADADAILQTALDAEAASSADARAIFQAALDTEAARSADARAIFQAALDAEAATRAADDGLLVVCLDAEEAARLAAVDALESALREAIVLGDSDNAAIAQAANDALSLALQAAIDGEIAARHVQQIPSRCASRIHLRASRAAHSGRHRRESRCAAR